MACWIPPPVLLWPIVPPMFYPNVLSQCSISMFYPIVPPMFYPNVLSQCSISMFYPNVLTPCAPLAHGSFPPLWPS